MADTRRILTDLQVLLADNVIRDISAQDLRDFLVSAIPTGRNTTKAVKASNSDPQWLAQSDYQCDGVADDVQIQAAIDALPL